MDDYSFDPPIEDENTQFKEFGEKNWCFKNNY